jgi:DNA polymerase
LIILDYETRSEVDLTKVGAYNYARHPSTDILFLALYDTDTDEEVVFDPCEETMPTLWVEKIILAAYVGAVNATFDRLIHETVGVSYGFPSIEYGRWYCISDQLRVNAMPANLEDGAKACKIADLKNPRGKQLIKLLCMPQEDGTFNEDAGLMQEMKGYCLDDARAAVGVYRATRQLTPAEHRDWLICERMNDKGVRVDRELAELAVSYAHAEQSEITGKLIIVTRGQITAPTQYQRIKKYIQDAVGTSKDVNDRRLIRLMTVVKNKEKKLTLDKGVRELILTAVDAGNLDLYEDIEELIRLLDAASASSVAKFAKMKLLASPDDDRVRGAFIHAGAMQTHRFSSKGLQLHNMKRACYTAEKTEEIKESMRQNYPMDDVMQTLSKLLRPALIPAEGHKFVVGDWSAIEARALPFLSGDERAEKKLDLFRNGVDTYIEAAKGIFKKDDIDADSPERQAGKVSELSLGYGGADGAFNAMAANYGVYLPEHVVSNIVKQWRRNNPWAVDFWRALEMAAKKAIRKRGQESFSAGLVTYHFIPQLLGGTLVCELPDGTLIQYPFAHIEHSDKGDNIVALRAGIKPKADGSTKGHWGTVRLWGGLLAENVTQAFCAGLLRNACANLGNIGKYLVAHVHDEVILEVPTPKLDSSVKGLQVVMETSPSYAKGLPLKAAPVILDRYGNH